MVVEMGVREKPRPGPEYLMQLMNDKKLMSSLPNFCGTSRTWSGCWTKLDELDEKKVENNEQREGIICLKQERQYLGNELTLAVEREKRKDQILELARSQQERADTELHGLRQVNEKQQHDLQLLHLNLGSSQELIRKQEEKILEIGEERLELNTFGLESPLRSMNSSPIRERPRGKSSLHGDLCVNDSVSPVRVNANEE